MITPLAMLVGVAIWYYLRERKKKQRVIPSSLVVSPPVLKGIVKLSKNESKYFDPSRKTDELHIKMSEEIGFEDKSYDISSDNKSFFKKTNDQSHLD